MVAAAYDSSLFLFVSASLSISSSSTAQAALLLRRRKMPQAQRLVPKPCSALQSRNAYKGATSTSGSTWSYLGLT